MVVASSTKRNDFITPMAGPVPPRPCPPRRRPTQSCRLHSLHVVATSLTVVAPTHRPRTHTNATTTTTSYWARLQPADSQLQSPLIHLGRQRLSVDKEDLDVNKAHHLTTNCKLRSAIFNRPHTFHNTNIHELATTIFMQFFSPASRTIKRQKLVLKIR